MKTPSGNFLLIVQFDLSYHGSLSGLLPVTRYRPSTKSLPTQNRESMSGHLKTEGRFSENKIPLKKEIRECCDADNSVPHI